MSGWAAWGAAALVLVVAAPSSLRADSRYSLRGNGEAIAAMRADVRALGGAETASSVPSLTGNPAGLVFAERSVFYGTYETEWVRTEESAGDGVRVRKDYEGLVPNLALIFPLPHGIGLGTGLLVDRRRGGRIERSATIGDGSGGQQEYLQIYEADGNLLRVPVLLGFRAGGAQAGTGVDLLLLNAKVHWRNEFPDDPQGARFGDSDDLDKTALWGFAWRLGLRVPIGSRLVLGAWGFLPSQLTGNRRFENETVAGSTGREIDLEADIAPRWSLGIEAQLHERVRVVGDWVHEGWEEADPIDPIDEFVDVDRYAVGIEWNPFAGGGGLESPLRAGYRTELLHVLDGEGARVREHVITAGSGFGIAGGRGDIDWYVEFGWRGEKGETEFLEHLVRFGVTLTGWEKWTRRRKPEEEDDW